jgi:hypothetical protein
MRLAVFGFMENAQGTIDTKSGSYGGGCAMPALVVFVIRSFANGFLIGTATALLVLLLQPSSMAARFAAENIAGLSLILFSMGSSFGMGSLATALWLETGED